MLIYGINPLLESLNSPIRPGRLILETGKAGKRLGQLRRLAEDRGIPVETHPDLDKLCGRNAVHQGAAGEFTDDWAEPLERLPEDTARLVIFDGLCDPHNFGAALRVCEVFGFHRVLYHRGNSSGLTPVAVKASAGAVFHLSLYMAALNRAIKLLKQRNFAIYALDAAGQTSIYDVPLAEPFCLVIGSEERGVRFNIRRQADALVSIPMQGKVGSLNVSCALSAALCEFTRRLEA